MKTFYLILMWILLIVACVIIMSALGSGNSAPQQGALAGFGCFFAILARIAQAAAHNKN